MLGCCGSLHSLLSAPSNLSAVTHMLVWVFLTLKALDLLLTQPCHCKNLSNHLVLLQVSLDPKPAQKHVRNAT